MKEEIEKSKTALIDFCLDFERFEKSKYLIDCMYHQEFGKLICEDLRLAILLDKYTNAIGMKKRGDEIEDIRKMISVAFIKPDKEYQKMVLKCQNVVRNSPIGSHFNEEYLKSVEEYFAEYCSKFHPFLRMNVSQMDESRWNFFTYFYRNNNLEGMTQIANEYKDMPKSVSYLNEEFIQHCKITIEEGTKLIQQQTTIYPYNKKEILEDDMKSAMETALFREKISEKKEQIAKLKNEYINCFGDIQVF